MNSTTQINDLNGISTSTTAPSALQALRRERLMHETAIRTVGWVYYYFAGVLGLFAVGTLLFGGILPALLMAPMVAGIFALGRGLTRFEGWARVIQGIISAIGLLGLPIGTVYSGGVLYALFSRKGSQVFTRDHHFLIEATPEIKSAIPAWALALIVIAVVGGLQTAIIQAL